MKISTAHLGLGAIVPNMVLAGQLKPWEEQRHLFEKRAVSNITVGSGNTNTQINSGSNNTNINIDPSIINNFNAGVINFYSNAPDCYYAKFCDTCNIVKVAKGNNTYVDQPCPVCPVETFTCPGYSTLKTVPHGSNGTSAVCNYQPPVCLSCHAIPAPPPPSLTTVAVSCPTCPASSTVITCPATAVSSIASVASVSGVSVAKSVASQATVITVTAASTVASPPVSTVVNVLCPSCPAGTSAVTVAQVTPVPGSPAPPAPPVTPGNVSSPGGAAPANPHFTGSATAVMTSVLSVVLSLVASTVMFL